MPRPKMFSPFLDRWRRSGFSQAYDTIPGDGYEGETIRAPMRGSVPIRRAKSVYDQELLDELYRVRGETASIEEAAILVDEARQRLKEIGLEITEEERIEAETPNEGTTIRPPAPKAWVKANPSTPADWECHPPNCMYVHDLSSLLKALAEGRFPLISNNILNRPGNSAFADLNHALQINCQITVLRAENGLLREKLAEYGIEIDENMK